MKIVGADLSASMLQKAKENLGRLVPLWVVEFRVGDAEDLPLEDRFADAVVEDMILHHCPRPRRAIAEMVKVLKKVGRLMMADLDRHDDRWLREEMVNPWLGFDLGKIGKWFEAASLKDVEGKLARSKCCRSNGGGRRAQIGTFIASGSRPKRSR